MGLSNLLRFKESSIRRFIDQNFPILDYLNLQKPGAKAFLDQVGLYVPKTILPNSYKAAQASLLGSAMDFRARMFFKGFDVRKTLAAEGVNKLNGQLIIKRQSKDIFDLSSTLYNLTGHHRLGLKFLKEFHNKWHSDFSRRRFLTAKEERELCRDSFIMACYERSYRGVAYIDLPVWKRCGQRTLANLRDTVYSSEIDEIEELSRIFRNKAKFLYNRNAILNPQFYGSELVGGADGDLVCNETIIDFKATDVVPLHKMREIIRQLIGYFLLDTKDEYRIDKIGAFFFRKAWYWEAPVWIFLLPQDVALHHLDTKTTPDKIVVAEIAKSRREEVWQLLFNSSSSYLKERILKERV